MIAKAIYDSLNFIVYLLLGEGLICHHLPRREYFPLKLAGAILILIGLAMVREWLPFSIGRFWYFFLFFLSIGLMSFVFRATWNSYFFAATIGYAIQNISYSLTTMTMIPIPEGFWYLEILINLVYFFIVFCVVFFAYVYKKNVDELFASIRNPRQTIISLIVIAVTGTVTLELIVRSGGTSSVIFLTDIISILVGILVLTSEFELIVSSRAKGELEQVRTIWAKDRKAYELSRENINLINIKVHDLRHRLDNLKESVDSGELEELKNAVDIYGSDIKTGLEALDLVISEKSPYLVGHKIRFSCLADIASLSYIPRHSLYSLFENAFSNAIEAVEKLPVEKRSIHLRGMELGDYVSIHIENPCLAEGILPNLDTTKKDHANHGYGLKSMRLLVERYQGLMSAKRIGDKFVVDILLPSKKQV